MCQKTKVEWQYSSCLLVLVTEAEQFLCFINLNLLKSATIQASGQSKMQATVLARCPAGIHKHNHFSETFFFLSIKVWVDTADDELEAA